MLHTCIMTVRYDFSLRAASIVATQVCQYTEWFRPTHLTCFSFVSYWVLTVLCFVHIFGGRSHMLVARRCSCLCALQ